MKGNRLDRFNRNDQRRFDTLVEKRLSKAHRHFRATPGRRRIRASGRIRSTSHVVSELLQANRIVTEALTRHSKRKRERLQETGRGG